MPAFPVRTDVALAMSEKAAAIAVFELATAGFLADDPGLGVLDAPLVLEQALAGGLGTRGNAAPVFREIPGRRLRPSTGHQIALLDRLRGEGRAMVFSPISFS